MMIDKETKMILTPEQFFEWVAKTWNECQERAWVPDSCEKTTAEALDKPI